MVDMNSIMRKRLTIRLIRFMLVALATIAIGACTSNTETTCSEEIAYPWQGIYVSEGYWQRDKGSDWGAVVIDSSLYVRIRYRADLVYPLCNYDFICDEATSNNGLGIDLGFAYLSGDTLKITDKYIYCDENKVMDNQFVRLREPLDDSTLIPVLHESSIKADSHGAFDTRQEGRALIIAGSNGACDTIDLGRQYVQYQFVDDLDNDGTLDLIIGLGTFHCSKDYLLLSKLYVYGLGDKGQPEPIEVEDYTQTPYASERGTLSWASVDSGILRIEFPLTNKTEQETAYKRIIKYKLTDSQGQAKRLVISSVHEEMDEGCYH